MSFEEWFKHYPKRNAVGLARQSYSNAILFKGVTEEMLMNAVLAYAKINFGKDKTYIPEAHKWIEAERWFDEDIQAIMERDKEKKELSGWKKQLSDSLGYETYKSWCGDANLENGILMVRTNFKAEYMKNNFQSALKAAGINDVRVFQ